MDFEPPTALVTDHFRLEPLGPQHNEADHAAWTSSIAHIRSTPGFPDGNWPPPEGMSLDRNLDDLRRHAADFEARTGFTFTVLEPVTGGVIGCVYLYPSESPDADVTVQSWVRAGPPSSMSRSPTLSPPGWTPSGRGSEWNRSRPLTSECCPGSGRRRAAASPAVTSSRAASWSAPLVKRAVPVSRRRQGGRPGDAGCR